MSIEERMTKVFEFITDPNNAAMSVRQSAMRLGMPETTFQRIRNAIYRRECECSPGEQADSDDSTRGEIEMATVSRGRVQAFAKGVSGRDIRMFPFDDHWLDVTTSQAHIMTFSPEMAERILSERNPSNRPIKPANVKRIAEELLAGRWEINGQTIIFNWDGNLNNGQHQLTACVQAGIPISSWVVFGVKPDSFHTLDIGSGRGGSDILAIGGEKNTKPLSAVLSVIWLDEQGRLDLIGKTPSKTILRDILERHPGARNAVDLSESRFRTTLLSGRIVGFCLYQFMLRDADAALGFFRDFKEGANLSKEDPVLMLRKRLVDDKASHSRMRAFEKLALTIKAWNHRYDGVKVKSLRWTNTEPYPAIKPPLQEG